MLRFERKRNRSAAGEVPRIRNLLTSLLELNNRTQSSFSVEIDDMRETEEYLHSKVKAAEERSSPAICKFTFSKTLGIIEPSIAKLERHLDVLRDSAQRLSTAQRTLDSALAMYTQQWADLEAEQSKWEEEAMNWHDQLKIELELT